MTTTIFRVDQTPDDTHHWIVDSEPLSRPTTTSSTTTKTPSVGNPVSEPTEPTATPKRQTSVQNTSPERAIMTTSPMENSSAPEHDSYILLALAAQAVDDLEGLRKANVNRLGMLTRATADSDGAVRGMGLPTTHPIVVAQQALVDGLESLEKRQVLHLEKTMKAHPLGPWVAAQRGVGMKTAGRLLGSIGDPYIRPELELEDGTIVASRPRLVSELWSYTGYGVVGGHAPRRQKGTVCNWNSDARMRAWNVVQTIIKAGGPWKDLYDQEKVKLEGSTHSTECARCTPAGKPAAVVGSPRSKAHIAAMCERKVAKELLKAMWHESKRLHEAN